ncbi:MAG: hypothetical protein AAF986_01985 [Pseudomonadota bacterium]
MRDKQRLIAFTRLQSNAKRYRGDDVMSDKMYSRINGAGGIIVTVGLFLVIAGILLR